MKKKFLLSTTIASAMFITGMAMPSVMAYKPEANNATKDVTRVSQYTFQSKSLKNLTDTISVSLNKKVTTLLREDVETLVEAKFGTVGEGLVARIEDRNGNEVKAGEAVGTGAKIILQNGRVITVVLYGDVNGDGILDNFDATAALKYAAGNASFMDAQIKASNVTIDDEVITQWDALRILKYTSNPEFTATIAEGDKEGETVANNDASFSIDGLRIDSVTTADGNVKGVDFKGNVITAGIDATSTTNVTVQVKVNVNIANWKLVSGVGVKDTSDATGKTVLLTINTEADNNEYTITNEDGTESMTIKVNVVDGSDVAVSKVLPGTSANDKLITVETTDGTITSLLDGTTITVPVNVNNMTASEMKDTDNETVKGKFYSLIVSTDQPSENVEVTGAVNYEAISGTKDVRVWLDTTTSSITVKNKYGAAGTTYTVTLDNTADLGVVGTPAIAAKADTDKTEYKNNQDAITLPVEISGDVITVKAPVSSLKAYKKATTDTEAKKWVAVLIKIGDLTDLTGNYEKPVASMLVGKTDGTDPMAATDTVLVWVDAEAETPVSIKSADEELKLTVKVENTDAVKIKTLDVATLSDATYTANKEAIKVTGTTAAAGTISAATVTVNTNSVKPYAPAGVTITEANKNDTWYAVVVDTGIAKDLVRVYKNGETYTDEEEYEYVVRDDASLSATEILLWVNSEDATTAFKVFNKNTDAPASDNLTITTAKTAAKLNVTSIAKADVVSSTVTLPGSATTLPEYVKAKLGNAIYRNYKNNIKYVSAATTTVTSTLNAMSSYERNGVTGAWVPVLVNIGADRATLAASECSSNVDVENTEIFGGTATQVLVWVDAGKAGNTEVTLVRAAQANGEAKETVKFNVTVEAAAEGMKLVSAAKPVMNEGKGAFNNDADQIAQYNANENSMTNLKVDKNNRIITFDVDTSKLVKIGEDEQPRVALLIDAGVGKSQILTGVSKAVWYGVEDTDVSSVTRTDESNWKATNEDNDNQFLVWLDIDNTTTGKEVQTIDISGKDTSDGDGLCFTVVINKK